MNSKSNAEGSDNYVMCCANCGKAGVDDIKLKNCTACKLVKYCSVECQKNHRPQHKKACKKRAAEIRDDRLFTQPDESHLGECLICCLPLPLDYDKFTLNTCCFKRICDGCDHANDLRMVEEGLEPRCVFCREPMPDSLEEREQNKLKRVKANDPAAMRQMGAKYQEEGQYGAAVEYWAKAAALGDIDAHFNLAIMYGRGEGVEKDMKKNVYHWEEAAIGGHPTARNNLGYFEEINGMHDRAIKHFIIAANLGDNDALAAVKKGFVDGFVRKEDYETALRGHQAAVGAAKSEQRDAAEQYYKRQNQE